MATMMQTAFKCLTLNENIWILNKISSKYVSNGLIDKSALARIMDWRRTADTLFPQPEMVQLTDNKYIYASHGLGELIHPIRSLQHIRMNMCSRNISVINLSTHQYQNRYIVCKLDFNND